MFPKAVRRIPSETKRRDVNEAWGLCSEIHSLKIDFIRVVQVVLKVHNRFARLQRLNSIKNRTTEQLLTYIFTSSQLSYDSFIIPTISAVACLHVFALSRRLGTIRDWSAVNALRTLIQPTSQTSTLQQPSFLTSSFPLAAFPIASDYRDNRIDLIRGH